MYSLQKRVAFATGIAILLYNFHEGEAFQTSIRFRLPIVSGDRQHRNMLSGLTGKLDCSSIKNEKNDYCDSINCSETDHQKMSENITSIVPNESLKSNKSIFWLSLSGILTGSFVLLRIQKPVLRRYLLAGGICAAISHSISTPLDVIKTRKQVDPSLTNLGIMQSALKIIKDDGGINALFAGLGPTALGYLFEGAIKFGTYEMLKPSIQSILVWSAAITAMPFLNSKTLGFLISGCVAGIAASIVLCPMEALRIRLVAEPEFGTGGWVSGGLSMIENEGVMGLWKGLSAMMTKQVPYTVTKNAAFDSLTSIAYSTIRASGYIITRETKMYIPFFSAVMTSILTCICSQPGDLLLSLVNAKEGSVRTRDFARKIMKESGFKGFFVGMKTRFLHVGMMVTVQLTIYDCVKRLCGISATGL